MEDTLKIGHRQYSNSEQVRERKGNGEKEVLLVWEPHTTAPRMKETAKNLWSLSITGTNLGSESGVL